MKLSYPSPDFDAVVAAVCDGTVSEEQARALNELLRSDPAVRDEYILRVELHARLVSDPELFAVTALRDASPVGINALSEKVVRSDHHSRDGGK